VDVSSDAYAVRCEVCVAIGAFLAYFWTGLQMCLLQLTSPARY